MVLSDNIFISS